MLDELIARGLPTHPNPRNIPHQMSKKRHTKEARIRAIREHEAGRSQADICRQLNITAPTFDRGRFVGPTVMLQLGRFE